MSSEYFASTANVATEHGASYLKRLCRHFSHKVPTTVTDSQGRIEFPFGACRINVDSGQMLLHVEVGNAEDLPRAEEVIESHLTRMANRDEPVVEWQRETNDQKQS